MPVDAKVLHYLLECAFYFPSAAITPIGHRITLMPCY
jgi:hypothetical protein